MLWFRHYQGLVRDDKLVAAALRARAPVERVVWLWGAILEDAANRGQGGKFALDLEEVARFLQADLAELEQIMGALTALKRIARGRVLAWNRRQFSSDSSTERVREWRAKRRGDVAATLPQRFGNGPESETESESKSRAPARARAAAPARACAEARPRTRGEVPGRPELRWRETPEGRVLEHDPAWSREQHPRLTYADAHGEQEEEGPRP